MRVIGYSTAEAAVEQKKLPEGEHVLEIMKAAEKHVPRFMDESLNPDGDSLYLFLTARGFEGVHVNLAAHWASKIKQLLEAVGMQCGGETGEELDVEELHGRQVLCKVKHNGDYVNVVSFARVPAGKPVKASPGVKLAQGDDGDVPF